MHQFAWKILGAVFKQTGRISESITFMDKSVKLNPLDAEAHNNYGATLQELGRLEEAEECYTQAIKLKPKYIEAYNNLGNLYKDQEKYKKAITTFNKVISINPNNAEVYYNKGVALKKTGKLQESILMYTKAIELNPQYTDAYNNLGNALNITGATEQAINAYKKSILFKSGFANAHLNLSLALLSFGSYREGLDEYEWRWKTDKFLPKYRQFSQPLWNKEKPLIGKRILIWSEQGVGDTITWSSCISHIASQAKHCILECQEKLVPLLKRSFPNIEVKAEDRSLDTERNDFDFHIPMGSLYKNLSTETFQKTKVDAFLTPDPDRVNYWKKRLKTLGNGPFIGVSWKSIVMSPDRLPNYASISEWFPLFRLPNIKFINLQPKDFEEFLRVKLTRFFKFVSSKPEIFMIMSNNHNLVNTFSINTPQFIIEIDYLKEEINDYIEKGIFPNFDVDLFALVIRPITDSLAQEMMSQKKIDINKYTEKCINFLTRGLGV